MRISSKYFGKNTSFIKISLKKVWISSKNCRQKTQISSKVNEKTQILSKDPGKKIQISSKYHGKKKKQISSKACCKSADFNKESL